MRRRTLTLKKENIVELSTAELDSVAGGGPITTNCGSLLTCNGPCHSDFMECITGLGCLSVGGC